MNVSRLLAPSFLTRSGRQSGRIFRLAIVTVLLTMVCPQTASGQEPLPGLDVVELSTSGDQVTVTVVAPPELRTTPITLGSFVVEMQDGPIPPLVDQVFGEDLDVVLLVDVSGSMATEALAAAKASGAAFVNQLPVNTRVALVSFGDEATLAQPFTTRTTEVVATLEGLEAAGETALHAAVVTAAQQFDPTRDAVRTIVLLSDGGNTVAQSSLGQAQAALVESGATLHAISIKTDEANDAELESLADSTGGSVASVEQIEEIDALQRSIAENLGNQYRLRFTGTGEGAQTARIQARIGDRLLAETSVTVTMPVASVVVPTPTGGSLGQPAPVPEQVAPSASAPQITEIKAGNGQALKWISIAAVSMAIVAIGLVLLTPGQRTKRRVKPAQRFGTSRPRSAGSGFRWIANRLADRMEGLLSRRGLGVRVGELLDSAGWKVRTSEFIVLALFAAIGAFLAGAMRSLLFGIVLAALVVMVVSLVLSLSVRRRRSAFVEQLTPTLQMLAGALRTGYSLPQAIGLVAKESDSPMSEEFSRVAIEMRLGRDLVEAIEAVGIRMDNEDFLWTTGAIDIARDVGGDLAGVLDNVAETIRTRDRIRRQIYSLSAEGRISAYILVILPFPIAGWQFIVNREYTGLLITDPLGRYFLFGGISLLIFGTFWLRRQIQIEY